MNNRGGAHSSIHPFPVVPGTAGEATRLQAALARELLPKFGRPRKFPPDQGSSPTMVLNCRASPERAPSVLFTGLIFPPAAVE